MKESFVYWSKSFWGICTAVIVLSVNGILPGTLFTLYAYFGAIIFSLICTILVILQWVTKKPKPVTWMTLVFGVTSVIVLVFATTMLWRLYTRGSTSGDIVSLFTNPVPYLSILALYLCFRALRTKFQS